MSSLTEIEKRYFEELFGMKSGNVLDFNYATFFEFFRSTLQLNIDDPKYGKLSKGKRLRSFWQQEPDALVGKILGELLKVWIHKQPDKAAACKDCNYLQAKNTVARLTGQLSDIEVSAGPPVSKEVLGKPVFKAEKIQMARSSGFEEDLELGKKSDLKTSDIKEVVRMGRRVFIGHGRSLLWREFKDFIERKLGLPWDEFNRVVVAGTSTVSRLSEMLDAAAFAFLLLTGEDELKDGDMQARMNVIHEAGLFQGKLGFTKAIILLEDGCAEFSNIHGLGQMRFPKGQLRAVFEDVREVLGNVPVLVGS
jgi:predicted nucleotide-binding protein